VKDLFFDAVTDKITYIANETRISRKCNIIVKPLASFLTVPYKISVFNNGIYLQRLKA
jgi:hypothetical protein